MAINTIQYNDAATKSFLTQAQLTAGVENVVGVDSSGNLIGADGEVLSVTGGGGGFTSTAFTTALPFTGNYEMPQTAVTGALSFTATGSTVGSQVNLCLVANGTNVPTFSSSFKEATGSSGYDNTANVKNYFQFLYTNNRVIYSIYQEVGDTGAADITAPTLSSAAVQNATPTVVAVTFSEALDQTVTQAAGDWAVSGHTVSSVAFASSTVTNLTVTPAFVGGEATRTVTYTNNANRVKDLAGNAAATSSATNITNNVVALTAPVNTVAPVLSAVTVGGALSSTNGTWTGNPTPTYTQQFKLDGVNIASNYTVVSGDIGKVVTCVVTATNSQGSASATSNSQTVTSGDVTAPTLTSATVENATPTTLTLVFSEALDQTKTLSAADFTLSGSKTDSSPVYVNSTTVSMTVTAFTNGEAITLDVATGAVRDVAGNNLAAITARAITNNVAAAGGNYVRFSNLNSVTESVNGSQGYKYDLDSATDYANTANFKIPANTNGYFDFVMEVPTGNKQLSFGLASTNTSTGASGNQIGIWIANTQYARNVANGINHGVWGTYVPTTGDIIRIGRQGTSGSTLYTQISTDGGVTFSDQSFLAHNSQTDLFPMIFNLDANASSIKGIVGSASTVAV